MARSEQQLSLPIEEFDFDYQAFRLFFDDQFLEVKRRDPNPGFADACDASCAEFLHKLGGMAAAW